MPIPEIVYAFYSELVLFFRSFGSSTQLSIINEDESTSARSVRFAGDRQKVLVHVRKAFPFLTSFTSIVFSFWTTTLDLAGVALDRINIPYTRVDGTMLAKQRQLALESFVKDPRIRTILISLRCGANGYVTRLHHCNHS